MQPNNGDVDMHFLRVHACTAIRLPSPHFSVAQPQNAT